MPVLPLVQHHQAEGEEIIDRRDQPARPGLEHGWAREPAAASFIKYDGLTGCEVRRIASWQPVNFFQRHAETRVLHAERLKDAKVSN